MAAILLATSLEAINPIDLERYKARFVEVPNIFLGTITETKEMGRVPPDKQPKEEDDALGVVYYWARVRINRVLRGDLKEGGVVDILWAIPVNRPNNITIDSPVSIDNTAFEGKEVFWTMGPVTPEDHGRPPTCFERFAATSPWPNYLEVIRFVKKEEEAQKKGDTTSGTPVNLGDSAVVKQLKELRLPGVEWIDASLEAALTVLRMKVDGFRTPQVNVPRVIDDVPKDDTHRISLEAYNISVWDVLAEIKKLPGVEIKISEKEVHIVVSPKAAGEK